MAVYWAGAQPAAPARRAAGDAGAGDDAAVRAGGAPAHVGRAADRDAGAGAGGARPLRLAADGKRRARDLVIALVSLGARHLRGRRAARLRAAGAGDRRGADHRLRPPAQRVGRQRSHDGTAAARARRAWAATSRRTDRWARARFAPGAARVPALRGAGAGGGGAARVRDDPPGRRQVQLAAGRRSARRRAVEDVRGADSPARLRPVPLERGRDLRARAPAHPPRRRRRRARTRASPSSACTCCCSRGWGSPLSGYLNVVQSDVRYVALPAIALALGAFLDEALEGNGAEPVAGLLMAIGTLIIARDFFLAPEELASVHAQREGEVAGHHPARRAVHGRRPDRRGRDLRRPGGAPARARQAPRGPTSASLRPDPAGSSTGRSYSPGGTACRSRSACAVLFAFYLAQGLVPRLSTHLSFKPVLESYAKFAHEGEKIGKYRIEGHGSTFYSKQTMVELPIAGSASCSSCAIPPRVFAMVPDRRAGGAGRRVQAGAASPTTSSTRRRRGSCC